MTYATRAKDPIVGAVTIVIVSDHRPDYDVPGLTVGSLKGRGKNDHR
jgi:hypothetical protein